jgi:hypothetical protein
MNGSAIAFPPQQHISYLGMRSYWFRGTGIATHSKDSFNTIFFGLARQSFSIRMPIDAWKNDLESALALELP